MKYPKKYLTTNPNIMKREINKHKDKADDDDSAYGPWDADYKSGKAGKGKKVPTKSSKYTKKFKELYGESEEFETPGNIVSIEEFNSEIEKAAYEIFDELVEDEFTNDEFILEDSRIDKALKNKAKKSGFPLGILRKVFARGFSAWKRGHVGGTVPEQWGLARVSSFIVGGRTTEVGDGALYKQAKKARAAKKKNK
jgi:hypothetical protein